MEGGYREGSCTASVICSVVDFPDAPPCEFWIIFLLLLSLTAGIIFTGEIPSQLQLFAKNLIYVV